MNIFLLLSSMIPLSWVFSHLINFNFQFFNIFPDFFCRFTFLSFKCTKFEFFIIFQIFLFIFWRFFLCFVARFAIFLKIFRFILIKTYYFIKLTSNGRTKAANSQKNKTKKFSNFLIIHKIISINTQQLKNTIIKSEITEEAHKKINK
jgi:hypothetical protein